jgi:hypothetical protein
MLCFSALLLWHVYANSYYETLILTGGIKTTSSNITANDTLRVGTGTTLNMGTNTLLGSFISNGTGTIQTQNTSTTPIPSGRTWASTIHYNATTGTQTVVTGTYAGLTLTENALKNAAGNLTVNGVLNLGANPNANRGQLELVTDYTDYATSSYTGFNQSVADAVTNSTSTLNNLASHVLTLGASATIQVQVM